MQRLVIQFIVGRRPEGVDEEDLPWQTINGEDYAPHEWERAWAVADTYDSDFDHRFSHRVVEADVEPPAPRPIAKTKTAPPPAMAKGAAVHAGAMAKLEGTPKPARAVNRQLTEFRAQTRFEANLARLGRGLAERVPFEFLLPIVELLEQDLESCGSTLLARRYREQFEVVRQLVAASDGKQTLRVVK